MHHYSAATSNVPNPPSTTEPTGPSEAAVAPNSNSLSCSAGRNCRRPTSPRSHAEPVRSYICQPAATIICAAAVPASRANQKRMKVG